ncbi:MAG: geranylgeranylglyceryl/heptaprenylglyceryl phosphate synthase [candidate division Zixibacteria bacterium]
MPLFDDLLKIRDDKGAGFLLLLDPDRVERKRLISAAQSAQVCGVDAILAGSSLITHNDFDSGMADIKRVTKLPVILFPGSSGQVSRHADGILYISLISGRNPTYLIEEQVKGAPMIKAFGLEPIPTGYMLIDSGRITSVQYISGTIPIPRNKNDIAMAHALAAQYMGMKLVYLEAGSGASQPVPGEMVTAVAEYCDLPVIVGGGIRRPEQAAAMIETGASFVVIGTRLEFEDDYGFMTEMADAIHSSTKTTI